MNKRKSNKGFTLIELVIVLVIIGILAVVSVPIYRGFVQRSIASEGVALAGSIRSAQRVYNAANDAWADSLDELDLDEPDGPYFNGSDAVDEEGNDDTPIQVHSTQGNYEDEIYVRMDMSGDPIQWSTDGGDSYKRW
ncbi:MAG: type IV pilin protein [Elusimicrobiota bacterium]